MSHQTSRPLNLLIEIVTLFEGGKSKESLVKRLAASFRLTKDRSVYSCNNFAFRVCISSTNTFSNTVLSLSSLKKYDNKPFIVILMTPDRCKLYLANSTFIKKVSHSSKELRVDNIRGSFNGSDIILNYSGLVNEPQNFSELFAVHQAFAWDENVVRLVEATNDIVPNSTKFVIDDRAKETILNAPIRASVFVESEDYSDLRDDLSNRVNKVRDIISVAALIDNVNLRGRVIEELVTEDSPEIIHAINKSIRDGEQLSLQTNQELGDYSKEYENFSTETDIKTKVLYLQSAPKAYNIDKLLEFLTDPKSVYLFFLIGIDEASEVKTCLISAFQSRLLANTRVQHHWAGRSSRGVTQFNGHVLNTLIASPNNEIDTDDSVKFLEKLIEL